MWARINKIISIITAVIFMLNSIGHAGPISSPQSIVTSPQSICIPELYGKTEKSNDHKLQTIRSKSPLVVLVKDAHCHYEAQRNIAKILETLARDYGINIVALEGGAGKLDYSRYGEAKNKGVKERVTDAFVKQGYLNGPEYLAITRYNELPIGIYGIEEAQLYAKDFISFRKTLKGFEEIREFIDVLKGTVDKLKEKIYGEELFAFTKKYELYKKNKTTLMDWIKYLSQKAPITRLKQNIILVMRSARLEDGVDFNKVEDERAEIIKECEKTLPKEEIGKIVKNSLLFRLGKISSLEYYTFLEKYVYGKRSANNLHRYIHLVKLQSKIDTNNLFNELDEIEKQIKESLFRDNKERELDKLDYRLNILNDLLNLRITRKELDYYDNHRNEFSPGSLLSFIKIQAPINNIVLQPVLNEKAVHELLINLINEGSNFYKIALERDKALVKNTLLAMEKEGKNKAVMVVGGFHAEGIIEELKKQGIDYVAITPKITKEQDTPYLKIMLDERIKPKTGENTLAVARLLAFGKENRDLLIDIGADRVAELMQDRAVVSYLKGKGERPTLGQDNEREFIDSLQTTIQGLRNQYGEGATDEAIGLAFRIFSDLARNVLPAEALNVNAARSPIDTGVSHMEGLKLRNGGQMAWRGNVIEGMDIEKIKIDVKKESTYIGKIEGKDVWIDNELLARCGDFDFRKYLSGQFKVLPPKKDEIVIALLSQSGHLFEDCKENGFIGVNEQLFRIEDSGLRIKLLKLGIRHELKHEAGTDKSEDELLIEDIIESIKIGITDIEIEILQGTEILEKGSRFIFERIKIGTVWNCYSTPDLVKKAQVIADLYRDAPDKETALNVIKKEALIPAQRIGDEGYKAIALSGIYQAIADLYRDAPDRETALRVITLFPAQGIRGGYSKAEALSGISQAIADLYKDAPDRETALKVIKQEALVPAQGLGNGYYKARALSGISKAIANLYKDAHDRETALNVIKEEALFPAQRRIEDENYKAIALSGIYQAIADLYRDAPDRETALEVIKREALIPAQGIKDEGYKAEALSGISQAIADLYRDAPNRETALRVIKEEVLIPAQGIRYECWKAMALSGIYQAIADLYKDAPDKETALRVIKEEALIPAQGIKYYKAEALSGISQAIANLYKDAPDKGTALNVIKEEALIPAQEIRHEDCKAKALSGIYRAIANLYRDAPDRETALNVIKEEALIPAQGIKDEGHKAIALSGISQAIANLYKDAPDLGTALEVIKKEALFPAQGICDREYKAQVLSGIYQAIIKITGRLDKGELDFIVNNTSSIRLTAVCDSFGHGEFNIPPRDIAEAYNKSEDRLIKLRAGYLRGESIEGEYTLEERVLAVLANHTNDIISYTTDVVKGYGDRGKEHILGGLVSLSSKIGERGYKLDGLMEDLGINSLKREDAIKVLKGMGYKVDEQGYILSPMNLVTSVYRGSAEIDHAEAKYVTHSITTALCHYAKKGGEAAKSGEEEVVAKGNKAMHEIDYALMEYEGVNTKKVDSNVSLAFSYSGTLPQYSRKRTVVLKGRSVLDSLDEIMDKQEKERLYEGNILNILIWLINGEIKKEAIDTAIDRLKKQIEGLKGLQNEYYFLAMYGSLDDEVYAGIKDGYRAGEDNRILLTDIFQDARSRQLELLSKSPEQKTRYTEFLGDLRKRNRLWETKQLGLTGYLRFKERMREGTYEEREASSEAIKLEEINRIATDVSHMEGLRLRNGGQMAWRGNVIEGMDIGQIKIDVKKGATNIGKIEGKDVWIDNELLAKCGDFDFREYLSGQFKVLPPKRDEIVIALLSQSEHLFEDCKENGFIGVNEQLFRIEDSGLRIKLLKLGIRHKLRYEAGTDKTEDELLIEDVIESIKIGITDSEIEILQGTEILEKGSRFIFERIKMCAVWNWYSTPDLVKKAHVIADLYRDAPDKETALNVIKKETLIPAQGIKDEVYKAQVLSGIYQAIADLYKDAPDKGTALEVIKREALIPAQGIKDEYWKAEALSGISQAIANLYRDAPDRETALNVIKQEALIPAQRRIEDENYKARALSGIYQAIADLYKDAPDRETALKVIKKEALIPAQGIRDEGYKAVTLSGIYQAIANLYKDAPSRETALEVIKKEALIPAQGIEEEGWKAIALSGIYQAIADLYKDAPDRETALEVIKREALIPAQGIGEEYFKAKALSGIYQAIADLYKGAPDRETALRVIKQEALIPAQGIKNEYLKAQALSCISQAIASLYRDAPSRETALNVIKEEALIPVQGIWGKDCKAIALSGIYQAIANLHKDAPSRETALRVIEEETLIPAQGIKDEVYKAQVLSGIYQAIANLYKDAPDRETALRVIKEEALIPAQGIGEEYFKAKALSGISQAIIKITGRLDKDELNFIVNNTSNICLTAECDSFGHGEFKIPPRDIAEAYNNRLIKLRAGYLRGESIEGEYTLEERVLAVLVNHCNDIISYTTDVVKGYGDSGKEHILGGLVPLSSKIGEKGYKLDGLIEDLGIKGLKREDAIKVLKGMGYKVDEQGYILSPMNLVTSVYRGSAEIDHAEARYVTHSITTALCHYAKKGGEAAKGGREEVVAKGNKAMHEIDYALMEYEGVNTKKVDNNVSLAFSYSGALPQYSRKRTVVLEGRSVLDSLDEIRDKQEKERLYEGNILNILIWLINGEIMGEAIDTAIDKLKEQIEGIKGLQNEYYFLAMYGYLDDEVYAGIKAGYRAGEDNRRLLTKLFRDARNRQLELLSKSPEQKTRYTEFLGDLRKRNKLWETKQLGLTGYLRFKERMREGTYEEREASSEVIRLEEINSIVTDVSHMEGLRLRNGGQMAWRGNVIEGMDIEKIKTKVKEGSTYIGKIEGKDVWIDNELLARCGDFDFRGYLSGQFKVLPPKRDEIVIALLSQSEHLFEDCKENGFIGVNEQLFRIEDSGLRIKLLKLGIRHKLRYEAGTNKTEDELLIEDIIESIKIGITDSEIEILQGTGILEEGSRFIFERIKMCAVWNWYGFIATTDLVAKAQAIADLYRDAPDRETALRVIKEEALIPAQGIRREGYKAVALSGTSQAIADLYKDAPSRETALNVIKKEALIPAQGIEYEEYKAQALSGIYRAIANLYRDAPDRETALSVIKKEALIPAQGIENEENKAQALSGISQAIADLYRDAPDRETVLNVIKEEALIPAQGMRREYCKAQALSGISQAIADLYKDAPSRETALKVIKEEALIPAQGIGDEVYKAKALSGIYQAIANLYRGAPDRGTALRVIKEEALIPAQRIKHEGYKAEVLFCTYQAIANLYRGAPDREPALGVIIKEALFHAQGIEYEEYKAQALSGIYQAIADLYKDAPSRETALNVIKEEALIPAQGIKYYKAEALSGIYQAIADLYRGASDRETALEVIKEEALIPAQGIRNEGYKAKALSGISQAIANLYRGAPDRETALRIIKEEALFHAQGIEDDYYKAKALSGISQAIADLYKDAPDRETALRVIKREALIPAQGIEDDYYKAQALSGIYQAIIKIIGRLDKGELDFIFNNTSSIRLTVGCDSFGHSEFNILPPDIAEAYKESEDRLIKLKAGYLRGESIEGEYTLEERVLAVLVNHTNEIISYTTDVVKGYGDRRKEHILGGLVSLSSKIGERGYKLDGLIEDLGIKGLKREDAIKVLKGMGYKVDEQGYILSPMNLVTSVYRGSAEIDHAEARYVTHSITTALCHYAKKGGEAAKGGEEEVVAKGNKAMHEIDYALMEYEGVNTKKVDNNVALAFSYSGALPQYSRKRTVVLEGRSVLDSLDEIRDKQEKERIYEGNILNILIWLINGEIRGEALDVAIDKLKEQIEGIKGLQNEYYFLAMYGYLDDEVYAGIKAGYRAGEDNRRLLTKLFRDARNRQLESLSREPGQSSRHAEFLGDLRKRNRLWETKQLGLTGYLRFKERMREGTYEERETSDKAIKLEEINRIATGSQQSGSNTIYLFFAGRITEEKGAEDFIRILASVRQRFKERGIDVQGRLLGAIAPSYKRKLEDLIQREGIEKEKVEFLGEYSPERFVEVLNQYKSRDCIFLHTLGMVTREVMAMGFPIVSKDGAVERGICHSAPERYKESVCSLIEAPEKRQELVIESRREAEEKYSSSRWLTKLLDFIEDVTGKSFKNRFNAYFTFSGFGYHKHGINEYYNKLFRYIAKRSGQIKPEVDVVSMEQRYFIGRQFPEEMYVPGVFEKANLREFNTYQHIGKKKTGKVPSEKAIRDDFLPALKDLLDCIQRIEYEEERVFTMKPDNKEIAERAVRRLLQIYDYFRNGYDVEKTMLSPLVEREIISRFRGSVNPALCGHMVSYDKKGTRPKDHFMKLIALMYMLAEQMPEGKDVSFTMQLFPPVMNIVHRYRGGPRVIYVEHTGINYNERALAKSVDRGGYPEEVRIFMKQYIALMKMIMVHEIDGYINPWGTMGFKRLYGDFFRGRAFHLPHGVDTDLYKYRETGKDEEVAVVEAENGEDFKEDRELVRVSLDEKKKREDILGLLKNELDRYITNRGRVVNQGSVGRGTDLSGRFDIDLIVLYRDEFDMGIEGGRIVGNLQTKLKEAGYLMSNIKQKPHNGTQWLVSFLLCTRDNVPITKVEITLEKEKVVYPDMFLTQIGQIRDKFGEDKVEEILEDILLIKLFMQRVVESYKWYHGGLGGIGVEQLVIQSGDVRNNGWDVIGLGSFAKAMELIYRNGFDKDRQRIVPLEKVRQRFILYNMDGSNLLNTLNEWSWKRLVHAARVFTEGKREGREFDDIEELRYRLEDALGYRPGNIVQAVEVQGENLDYQLDKLWRGNWERVGKDRYYLFLSDTSLEINIPGARIIKDINRISSNIRDSNGKAGYEDKDSNPQIIEALKNGEFVCVDANLGTVNNVGPYMMKEGNAFKGEELENLRRAISKLDDADRKILEGLLIIFIPGLSAHYSRQKYNQIYFDRDLLSNPKYIEDLKWQMHHEIQEKSGKTHAELIREELMIRFKIDIDGDLKPVLEQKLRDLLRILELDGIVTEDELEVIVDKAKMAVEIFNRYKGEGIGERLELVQEIVAVEWAREELERNNVPEFIDKLIKALGGDEEIVRGLVMDLYNYDGYDDYFVLMLKGIRTMFGIKEGTDADKYLRMLDRYVMVKSKFEVKGNEFVSSGDQIYNVLMEYRNQNKLKGLAENADMLLSKMADIVARYLADNDEVLNLFKDEAKRRQVKEGIEALIRRKGLAEQIEPQKFLPDMADLDLKKPLVVESRYLLIAKKGGGYAISAMAEQLKWLLLKAGNNLMILYDGAEGEKRVITEWLGNGSFITDSEYPADKKGVVAMLTHDTAERLKDKTCNHRVVKGVKNGEDDLMMMSHIAGILGSVEELSEESIRWPFSKLYKAYYKESKNDNEISGMVQKIIMSIKNSISIIVELPPIAPFVKPCCDALKRAMKMTASAA